MKCTIFLFTFHFYVRSGHALHTCKCQSRAYHTHAPHLFTTHKVQSTVQSTASRGNGVCARRCEINLCANYFKMSFKV